MSYDLKHSEERRREALLRVSPQVFVDFLLSLNDEKQDKVTIDGLPPDSRVTAVHYDISHDEILIRLHSETFEPVSEGAHFPYINPVVTRHYR